jgi:hypothetical protein
MLPFFGEAAVAVPSCATQMLDSRQGGGDEEVAAFDRLWHACFGGRRRRHAVPKLYCFAAVSEV